MINKIDLAEMVGADLKVMQEDTFKMRKDKPWFFTNIKTEEGIKNIEKFLLDQIQING